MLTECYDITAELIAAWRSEVFNPVLIKELTLKIETRLKSIGRAKDGRDDKPDEWRAKIKLGLARAKANGKGAGRPRKGLNRCR